MDQDNNEELDLSRKTEVADEPIRNIQSNLNQQNKYISNQLQRNDGQVCNLERQLLLNNNITYNNALGNDALSNAPMSNWVKVILSALAVFIPGIGQIVGIILGLVFVSNDINADKRSFGAALITVSVVAFILSSFFWFIIALAFGPQFYY